MNKQLLHEGIIRALEEAHQAATDAALQAHDTATNKESIAENKYDTFGLEASYLAHGQAKRVAEYEAGLAAYNDLAVICFSDDSPVGLGALVQLQDDVGTEQYLFLGPAAGGIRLSMDDKEITLITTSSPLGEALIDRCVGDEVEIKLSGQNKSYEIVAIF